MWPRPYSVPGQYRFSTTRRLSVQQADCRLITCLLPQQLVGHELNRGSLDNLQTTETLDSSETFQKISFVHIVTNVIIVDVRLLHYFYSITDCSYLHYSCSFIGPVWCIANPVAIPATLSTTTLLIILNTFVSVAWNWLEMSRRIWAPQHCWWVTKRSNWLFGLTLRRLIYFYLFNFTSYYFCGFAFSIFGSVVSLILFFFNFYHAIFFMLSVCRV